MKDFLSKGVSICDCNATEAELWEAFSGQGRVEVTWIC